MSEQHLNKCGKRCDDIRLRGVIPVPDTAMKWDPNGHEITCANHGPIFQVYLCPRCGVWAPWSFGAADDSPEACDDCWAEMNEEIAGAG